MLYMYGLGAFASVLCSRLDFRICFDECVESPLAVKVPVVRPAMTVWTKRLGVRYRIITAVSELNLVVYFKIWLAVAAAQKWGIALAALAAATRMVEDFSNNVGITIINRCRNSTRNGLSRCFFKSGPANL